MGELIIRNMLCLQVCVTLVCILMGDNVVCCCFLSRVTLEHASSECNCSCFKNRPCFIMTTCLVTRSVKDMIHILAGSYNNKLLWEMPGCDVTLECLIV